MWQKESIFLRPIEQKDIPILLIWENDVANWRYSETEAPFSLPEINNYVETASRIRENKQLRMMICLKENNEPIGTIDLYQIDFRNRHGGIGILLATQQHRQKGYAKEALQIIEEYAFEILNLHQLYCDIQADNTASIRLFEKMDYNKTGTKKDWYSTKKGYTDALFYQKFIDR